MTGLVWCVDSLVLATRCDDHDWHREVQSPLGPQDEPRGSGSLVLVWADTSYRTQEVWVNSGANVGAWYCLGGEFGRPQVWNPPPSILRRTPPPPQPAGTVPSHPDWGFVLSRGPVTLLVAADRVAYRNGWRNGRISLVEQIEALAEEFDSESP